MIKNSEEENKFFSESKDLEISFSSKNHTFYIITLFLLLCFFWQSLIAKDPFPLTYDESRGVKILGVSGDVALLKDIISSKVMAYKVGQSYESKFKILAVERDRIKIQDLFAPLIEWLVRDPLLDSARERAPVGSLNPQLKGITSQYKEPGFERDGGSVQMTEQYRESIVQSIGKIIMQAAAEPVIKDGVIIGFMLSEIDPGSIFNKAGFVDQDIITKINDESLSDTSRAIRILNSLKKAQEMNVELLRGGQPITLRVSVK